MRKSNILFSIVFLVIIFGFFFIDIFTPDLKFSYSENRTLQQKFQSYWQQLSKAKNKHKFWRLKWEHGIQEDFVVLH